MEPETTALKNSAIVNAQEGEKTPKGIDNDISFDNGIDQTFDQLMEDDDPNLDLDQVSPDNQVEPQGQGQGQKVIIGMPGATQAVSDALNDPAGYSQAQIV